MNKTLFTILLFVLLLTACGAKTPAAVPPMPPSATPDQSGPPTAYPLPAATSTQAVAAYPEPQKPAAQAAEPTAYPEMAAGNAGTPEM
jgi:predicted small lipoprotein YifL